MSTYPNKKPREGPGNSPSRGQSSPRVKPSSPVVSPPQTPIPDSKAPIKGILLSSGESSDSKPSSQSRASPETAERWMRELKLRVRWLRAPPKPLCLFLKNDLQISTTADYAANFLGIFADFYDDQVTCSHRSDDFWGLYQKVSDLLSHQHH